MRDPLYNPTIFGGGLLMWIYRYLEYIGKYDNQPWRGIERWYAFMADGPLAHNPSICCTIWRLMLVVGIWITADPYKFYDSYSIRVDLRAMIEVGLFKASYQDWGLYTGFVIKDSIFLGDWGNPLSISKIYIYIYIQVYICLLKPPKTSCNAYGHAQAHHPWCGAVCGHPGD